MAKKINMKNKLSNKDLLVKLIQDYLDNVNKALKLLEKNFNTRHNNILQRVFSGKIPRKGVLDLEKKILFSFHGVGCQVDFGKIKVDFDFVFKNNEVLVDEWKIIEFYNSQKENYPEFKSSEEIKKYFGFLVKEKYLIKSDKDEEGLYYIKKII